MPSFPIALRIRLCPAFLAALITSGCGSSQRDPDKVETIPLHSMYATVPSGGMKRFILDNELDAARVECFIGLMPRVSNLFLTKQPDFKNAVDAAVRFEGFPVVELPAADDKSQVWLIIYLGAGHSSPPRWTIDSVELDSASRKIKVTFSPPPRDAQRTADLKPHFVIVPLANLTTGIFDLELHNSNERVLTRRVHVQEPQR